MKLHNITKVYHNKQSDVKALENIDLEIQQKGITAIVGASGCGKTTLLHIISGKDTSFTGQREYEESIEMIEQEIMLFESMSVKDNLSLINDDELRINGLLKHFHMEEFAKQKVKKLSIGQKKRVQIIRSLLCEPDYLLCDEPTAALDHENAELVMDMLQEIGKSICVIVVTHEIMVVDQYADTVVKMGKGVIDSIEVKVDREEIQTKSIKNEKKSVKQHLIFLWKYFSSRKLESLFQFVLIFIMCVCFFASFLFNAVSVSVDAKERWRTSENIIYSVTNEGNNSYRKTGNEEFDKKVNEDLLKNNEKYALALSENAIELNQYYDLYAKDDLNLISDNLNNVIAYQTYWNFSNLHKGGSFAPPNHIFANENDVS